MLILALSPVYAQNPFGKSSSKSSVTSQQSVKGISVFDAVITKTTQWQRVIRTRIAKFVREIKKEGFGSAFLILLCFSFLYGLVHALGPGHGKTITVSYFLSGKRKITKGLVFGYTVMLVHALSGALITLVIWFFLERARMSILNDAVGVTQKISFSIILIIGVYLLFHNYHEYRHLKHGISEGGHGTGKNGRNLLITAIAIGIVPCPGTATIIIFCLSNQLLIAGLIAIFFVALGMGLTLSIFAIGTIVAQSQVLKLVNRKPGLYRIAFLSLSQTGAILIIFISLVMLV